MFPHRVAFHPTCHSVRMLEIGDRPRRLLGAVEGLELVEIAGADQCCGFGGTFAVKNAETSLAMGADKLARGRGDRRRRADRGRHVVPAPPRRDARRAAASPIRVLHLAEILRRGALSRRDRAAAR